MQRVALCAAAKQVTSEPTGSQSPKRIPQDRRGLESDAASEISEEENDEEDRDALLAEGAEILVDYLSLRQTAAVSAP